MRRPQGPIKARDLENLRPLLHLALMYFRKQVARAQDCDRKDPGNNVESILPANGSSVKSRTKVSFDHPQEPKMKKSLAILIAMAATLSSGFIVLENTRAIAALLARL